jgi:hypothetical protein
MTTQVPLAPYVTMETRPGEPRTRPPTAPQRPPGATLSRSPDHNGIPAARHLPPPTAAHHAPPAPADHQTLPPDIYHPRTASPAANTFA